MGSRLKWWKDFADSLIDDVTTGKVKDRIFQLNRDYGGMLGPEGGVMIGAALPKLVKGVDPKKFGKAIKLIEDSGGVGLKINKDGLASWKNAGKKFTANLKERFGPRNLKMNPRALGTDARTEDAEELAAGGNDFITKKANRDDIVSRVSDASGVSREKMKELAIKGKSAYAREKLYDMADEDFYGADDVDDLPKFGSKRVTKPKMESRKLTPEVEPAILEQFVKNNKRQPTAKELTQLSKIPKRVTSREDQMFDDIMEMHLPSRHAADAMGASTEEVSRAGKFYKLGKQGEPTYLSKSVDAGPDDVIVRVNDEGVAEIYQGSGTPSDLIRFNKTRTGNEITGKQYLEAGVRPKKGRARSVIKPTQIPNINLGKRGYPLKGDLNGKKITFASDFDKAAYTLASSKIPDPKLMKLLTGQLGKGFSRDTLLQHGIRIKNRVNQLATAKKPLVLHPRSVNVITKPEDPSMARQIMGVASEFKFGGDLPALRQSFRPTITHPFKSGLPAFKRAFKGITEKGYREEIEKLPEELSLYHVQDTAKALGPTKANALYPGGLKELAKLGGTKSDVYDYFGTGNLGERIWGIGEYPKMSKRMFDLFQRSIRGTEVQRMADLLGKSVEDLATEGHSELPALVRSVNEHTGYGPLGKAERFADNLSMLFNAPRNTMAGIQTWNPLNYLPESMLPNKIVKHGLGGRYGTNMKSQIYLDNLKDTGKLLGGYAGLKGLSELTGEGEIEYNPLATNVGANFDNWRPDIFGGGKGNLTTLAKAAQPVMKFKVAEPIDELLGTDLEDLFTGVNASGDPVDFEPIPELVKYLRYRVKPGPAAMAVDLAGYKRKTGAFENAIGEDTEEPYDEDSLISNVPGVNQLGDLGVPTRWLGGQVTPSWPEDTYDAFTGAGIPQGLANLLIGGAGMGSATYDSDEEDQLYRPEKKFIEVPVRGDKKTPGFTGVIR